MTRLLIVFVLLPFVTNAQYSQSDPFEKVEMPIDNSDFVNVVNFWKQLNLLENENLLKFDSIVFFKNDTLKYIYYISELKSFTKYMTRSDSAIKASTDSVYNKKLNSYDTYFTDIEKNRFLDNRKYLNNDGLYYKAEQFSEGDVAVVTNWSFDSQNKIIKETNEFKQDSSTYQMVYKRGQSIILQRHANIKTNANEFEHIIDYNKRGGITKYTYTSLSYKTQEKKKDVIKVERNNDNLTKTIAGQVDGKSISFVFSYLGNTIKIDRLTSLGKTEFKLIVY